VGYVVFNDHQASAEGRLNDAITTLKIARVTDLVLDLRYNEGR
jgi:carboxyl-terminal processing protease